MKRTPLRPGTKPLARSSLRRGTTPLRRKARLNPVNEERAARLRREQFGAKAEWIRSLPCATCDRPRTPSDPSHVKTRGAGGKAKHLVPMCREDHEEFHRAGIDTFEERRLYPGALLALAEHYTFLWGELPAEERERWGRVYREKHENGKSIITSARRNS